MTKDVMTPIINDAKNMGQQATEAVPTESNIVTAWNCTCGKTCITSKFCPECGSPKIETDNKSQWDCSCGCKNITSNFCPNCGSARPVQTVNWNCPSCGTANIASNFCPNCGKRKGE